MKPNHHELPRYHSLDAMRASAMLLGVVLHAAWMYVPAQWGAPVSDATANPVTWFVTYWTHQFRMHAFFFIAGFFASMACVRRGYRAFLVQRLKRIGLPLVIGWIICYPLFVWQYSWGATLTGANMSGKGVWEGFKAAFSSWESFRNGYDLTHLWFLYLLLVLYAATLASQTLVRRVVDRNGRLQAACDGPITRVLQSPWSVLWLALVTALVNLPPNWDIVPTPGKLSLHRTSFLTYWLFFGVGWFFYARPQLLESTDRRWKALLAAGCVLSLGMFGFYSRAYQRGALTDRLIYPGLDQAEFRDWSGFRRDLLAQKDTGDTTLAGRLWGQLAAPARRLIEREEPPTLNERIGFANYLSFDVLTSPGLSHGLEAPAAGISGEGTRLLSLAPAKRSPEDVRRMNRLLLEAAFPGRFAASSWQDRSSWWTCVVYTAGYCLVSWLLTFGFLGFFRRYFSHPHATWRYLADSSYWLYLVHLPVLFLLEIPMVTWKGPWPLKFALLNVAAMAIMVPTYHYLVRSTVIGETLNGRRYPFVPLFGRKGIPAEVKALNEPVPASAIGAGSTPRLGETT